MDIVNYILVGLIVLIAVLLGAVDKIFNGEGEVFQVYSTLLSSFSAAFIARITPHVAAALSKPNGAPSNGQTPAPPDISSALPSIPMPPVKPPGTPAAGMKPPEKP